MLRDELFNKLGDAKMRQSCLYMDNSLEEMLQKLGRFKNCIEIGTMRGLSTIILSKNADKVYTFDIKDYPERFDYWRGMHITNIFSCVTQDREHIQDLIRCVKATLLEFDLAFIDAVHDYSNVKADFEMVKFCKNVVFHDADLSGVDQFLEEIKAKIYNKTFAFWSEDENKYSLLS